MSAKKNKILLLIQLPPPIHGVSIMNRNLIESGIILEGFNTKVIQLKFTEQLTKIGRISFVKFIRIIVVGFQIFKSCFFFRPEIVYFTLNPVGFAFYRDVLYVAILKMFRSKRIYHLHGKGITKNAKKNKINKLLYQFVFNNSYAVCLSDILSKDISMFHTKKNFIVNNGIKVIDSEEKRENVGIIQLLFLSNLIVEKGLFDFLEAIKYLKDIEGNFYVTIIGEPFDISEKQLLEYIITNNLANVRYEGAKYGNEKHDFFKKPTIFVFPSRNDAFGLSIIEAMQFGIPVIATNEGGIPDIIDDGINGFLIPKSRPEIIAEKIRFLLNNPIQRIKMGQNAKNKFFDRFTITHFEENMKNVFHEVITEN